MKLQTALDELELGLRRRLHGEERARHALALDALREFLLDHAGIEESAAVRPEDLEEFLFEYYPAGEEPDPEVGSLLLEACRDLAAWLVEHREPGLAAFAAGTALLERELGRIYAAHALLRDYTLRSALAEPVTAEPEEGGPALVTAGLDRIVRLDEVDYAAALTDRFALTRLEGEDAWFTSPSRQVLGEPDVGPVRLPGEAPGLLRPGDIIHAEMAPGSAGWDLLEVFGIRPGGAAHDARPRRSGGAG